MTCIFYLRGKARQHDRRCTRFCGRSQKETGAAELRHHSVDAVEFLHVEGLRGVLLVDTVAVKEEAVSALLGSHAGTVGIHKLLELGGLLDLELDLVAFGVADLGGFERRGDGEGRQ